MAHRSRGPTRWGNQLNGNPRCFLRSGCWSHGPHSLGQSVEWKQGRCLIPQTRYMCGRGPTRWGNQLNGNGFRALLVLVWPPGPTRWGNQLNGNCEIAPPLTPCVIPTLGPTRWGNQLNGNVKTGRHPGRLLAMGPTRWGNQLNGNCPSTLATHSLVEWPHSLGQSVEWKLGVTEVDLNVPAVAPLAGAIS